MQQNQTSIKHFLLLIPSQFTHSSVHKTENTNSTLKALLSLKFNHKFPTMMRKVVVKLPTANNQKSRSKAMKIAVGVHGVNSASWAGPEKTQIEVTGDGIDSVELVSLLRKKFGSAELEAVAPVEEKKDEEKKKDDSKPPVGVWPWTPAGWPYGYACCPPYYVY